jgi:hypothetical protein
MSLLADDQSDTVQIDESKKYYEELVGEGKKFKDQEALARSKYEADSYIEILKRRSDEMRQDALKWREEALAKAKLEELIDQLQSKSKTEDNTPVPPESTVKPFDPKEIEDLFSKKIREHEQSKKQQENSRLVKDKLIERFGKGYQSTVKQQIEELGISEDIFNQMAENYPQMLFKTLELDKPRQTENFQAPPRNTVQGLPSSGKKDRTWSYYQELKKTNPKLYYDLKISKQMQEDYQRLGKAFEDGDFNA